MSKKINEEQAHLVNLDSRIFLETQEDFVFSREIDLKKELDIDREESEPVLEDWWEVEGALRDVSPAV